MSRYYRVVSVLVLLMLWGTGLQGFARSPKALFGDPEVKLYLHDGTDVTGRITKVTEESLTLQTSKGSVTVPRKKYQGMILNTPDGKKVGERVTRDPMAMISYGQYSYDAKQKITKVLGKALKSKCTAATLKEDVPVVHVQIDRQGRVTKTFLLNASNCADVDASLLKNIQNVKLDPLPKDHPFTFHSINYFYTKP